MGSRYQMQDAVARGLHNSRPYYYDLNENEDFREFKKIPDRQKDAQWKENENMFRVHQWMSTVRSVVSSLEMIKTFNKDRFLLLSGYKEFKDSEISRWTEIHRRFEERRETNHVG